MPAIVLSVRSAVKQRLLKNLRRCRSAATRLRSPIVVTLLNGRSARQAAEVSQVHPTTVDRVRKRFGAYGEAGLGDGRADNGAEKRSEAYLRELDWVVRRTPQDYGWRRSTWTRALLVETLVRRTGVRVHPATLSRALARIKARRGRPPPTVGCPWAKAAQTRRLNRIAPRLASLPRRERAFSEDEVDIHLNPKVGLAGMGLGQPKEVLTPGPNEQRYRAGALDIRTGVVTWVEGQRKTSDLFLDLLDKLVKGPEGAPRLHLVLDHYRIHSSTIVGAALRGYLAGRVVLHFLPPSCPDHNRIERIWQDWHANVTRNHTCPSMAALMNEVRYYLRKRNRRMQRRRAA